MAIYAVFESTNMKSTRYAERIFDAIADTDIENGTFGYLDGLADGEDVTYHFVPGYKSGETVVVVDQPAWTEDTSRITNQRKDKFINKAGNRFRVRVVAKNDEFAISEDGVTLATRDNLDVGVYFTIDANSGKLVVDTNKSTSNPVMEAQVMRKRISGGTLATAANNYGFSRMMYEAQIKTLM